jgi:predicted NAD/FAD-dependent oxidoreductase
MAALGRHLAADLAVRQETRIARLTRTGRLWHLTDEAGQSNGPFDKVIVALPAPQACALLGDHPLTTVVQSVQMTPCWTVMAAFGHRVDVPWDGAFNEGSPLVWMARDSSKPGRPASLDCWVLQAAPDWSAAHQDDNPAAVTRVLLDLFGREVSSLPPVIHRAAHRWLYSATPRPLDRLTLSDPETGLVLCGDWLAGGRIEGAFRSGVAAADFFLPGGAIHPGSTPRG